MLGSVDELIAAGLDYCDGRGADGVPRARSRWRWPTAGVHALIEKPLAPDVASAQRIADAFEPRGLVGAVGHIERYNPALQQLRARLEHGELGAVYQVATRRQGPFPARIADVGVVKDLATHDIDLTAWVTQQPYRSVSARTRTRAGASTRTWWPSSASCPTAPSPTTW